MTVLHLLGSGSRGNAFAVATAEAFILVDAGFSARELERRVERAGLALDRLAGIVVTHEHGDHARGAARLAGRRRVPLCCSPGTWAALGAPAGVRYLPAPPGEPAPLGPFTVEGARTSHDAAEPLALALTAPDGGRLGVAYDLGRPTQTVRHLLRGCAAVVVEANHDEVLLRTSAYPAVVRQRIAGSGGHLSNRAAADLLLDILHPALRLVVLAHLSERCNTPDCARDTVEPLLRREGFTGEVVVAGAEPAARPVELRHPASAA